MCSPDARLSSRQVHATPFFYSHIEVKSYERAGELCDIFSRKEAEGDPGSLVRSLRLHGPRTVEEDPTPPNRHPYFNLYTWLLELQYLSFGLPPPTNLAHLLSAITAIPRDLAGIHGLVISPALFPHLHLLLLSAESSLSCLTLCQAPEEVEATEHLFDFPLDLLVLEHMSLDVSYGFEDQRGWLGEVASKWKTPMLAKVGCGVEAVRPMARPQWPTGVTGRRTLLQFDGLAGLLQNWSDRGKAADWADDKTREISFLYPGRGNSSDPFSALDLPSWDSVRHIVIVQRSTASPSTSILQDALVRFVQPSFFPSLRRVSWVCQEGNTAYHPTWSR